MKLYSVTSLSLEQIYVFAESLDDAADGYTAFKAFSVRRMKGLKSFG